MTDSMSVRDFIKETAPFSSESIPVNKARLKDLFEVEADFTFSLKVASTLYKGFLDRKKREAISAHKSVHRMIFFLAFLQINPKSDAEILSSLSSGMINSQMLGKHHMMIELHSSLARAER